MDTKNSDDNDFYSVEPDDEDDAYARELKLKPTVSTPKKSDAPPPKTFHSKKSPHPPDVDAPPKRKRRFSYAETSGIAISAVMLLYSLAEADKPLFFVSAALMISLTRPLIGALFGKHNRAVQNALHTFSIVLFIGALIMLFLSG